MADHEELLRRYGITLPMLRNISMTTELTRRMATEAMQELVLSDSDVKRASDENLSFLKRLAGEPWMERR